MYWLLPCLCGILTLTVDNAASGQSSHSRVAFEAKPIQVKVLVLNFDPRIASENQRPLHEVCRWNHPRKLADGYIADLKKSSDGRVDIRIVDWIDIDAFHRKVDGFLYTGDGYLECHRTNKGWHQPDTADYVKTIHDFKIVARIDSGAIDELWFFGAPYFGYSESAMAGPGAFYINGHTFPQVNCKRAFAIMGFSYERGIAEMLHNLCHRVESTMSRIYGGWKADELTSNWARFAANERQSNGVAAVGTCHWPPNAERDYDYSNRRIVHSTADNWLTFPWLSAKQSPVNCETWGGPDYHRNYMNWWFHHLPRAPGTNADGRLNNWWEYIFRFNAYDSVGRPKNEKD